MTTKLPIYSPSQLKSWVLCPRKWGLDKIDRLHRTQHKSAVLGEAMHSQLEGHLTGKALDFASNHEAARLAQELIQHLPPPGTEGLHVENHSPACKFLLPLPSRKFYTDRSLDPWDLSGEPGYREITRPHLWTGRIDWLLNWSTRLLIGDHKSTSKIQYVKTEESLTIDIQANVYAKYGFTIRPDLARIDLQWTYALTKGALISVPVRTSLTREQVDANFEIIDAEAERITQARNQVQSGMELPYNSDACEAFGGCPYQSKCNLSPMERMRQVMANPTDTNGMSLLEQMKARQAQGQTPVALPAPGAFPSALSPLASMLPKDAGGRITHAPNGKPLNAQQVQTQAFQDPNTGGYHYLKDLNEHTAPIINWITDQSPQAPPPPAPAAVAAPAPWTPPGVPAPLPFQPPAQTGPINPPEWQPPPLPAPTVVQQAPVAMPPVPSVAPVTSPETPEGGKRRGRPKGSKNVPKDASAPQFTPTAATNPGAPAAIPNVGAAESLISNLYINCRPVDGIDSEDIVELSDIVADVNARIRGESQLGDWRLVDFKGAGLLAVYTEDAIRSYGGVSHLIVNMDTPEGKAVCNRLCALSGVVIQGA